jgi:hypothetical protein
MGQLKELIGSLPGDKSAYVERMRFHQGWWRAFVLNLSQGLKKSGQGSVCSSVPAGSNSSANFLTDATIAAKERVLRNRKEDANAAGLVDIDRLERNLLSSQPLAFNFFGHLAQDLPLASKITQSLFGIKDARVIAIHFEFGPGKPSGDNTAFDVAIQYEVNGKTGLIGIECKYVDTFSAEVYEKPRYRELHEQSDTFEDGLATYVDLKASRFNQLFRTQLLAEGLLLQDGNKYSQVHTCLFCSPSDEQGLTTGRAFEKMIRASERTRFRVVTYQDFIVAVQREALSWEDREWTMKLWARYLALELSAKAYEEA